MALPTSISSLHGPASSRGLAFPHSQVGGSGKFSGRPVVLLSWRRRSHWGFQRTGAVRVTAMAGRKKQAGKGGENERPELKLEANDLMELEFGRLLGEPRQATLAKVIGRKMNPEASFIDIEKKPVKEFKSSSPSKLSEAEFARLLNKEGRPNASRPPLEGVYKPRKDASEDSESLPGLVKPPSRPGQPLPQAPRTSPKTSSPPQAKKPVPIVTFGPSGFAAQTKNKPQAEEDDYMNLVQKPTISSPDSYKPSWPKIDSVPPMLMGKSKKPEEEEDYTDLVRKPAIPSPEKVKSSWPKTDSVPVMMIGKSKKSVEPIDESLLRKPRLGDDSAGVRSGVVEDAKGSGRSEISEEQFSKLLKLAGLPEEDQDMASEASTSTPAATNENLSKPKKAPKLGVKPVLAANPPPPQVDGTKAVASKDASVSKSSSKASPTSEAAGVEAAGLAESAEPTDSDAEVNVASRGGLDEATLAKDQDTIQPDPEQSIMQLVNKASRIAPIRPPKRLPQAIPVAVKAKITSDPAAAAAASADERLAGWSDEVKAAVKRSEAALPNLEMQASSESDFDQLLQRRKAELRQRPVPPPTPKLPPNPAEESTQQRISLRPLVPSPKPPRDATASVLQQGGILSDKGIPSKEEEDQDWARAEALCESKTIEEVVFTRSTSNGMLANFGSIVGFLPAYELPSRRRPPSFSAWAQENGFKINRKLKPSAAAAENDEQANASEAGVQPGTERTGGADEEYKRLLGLFGKFRGDLLSALVGKTAKVVVVSIDRERKQLRFSEKEAEGEGQELAQKRAELMTSLNVGDIVKCTVKKVTNFGAFVELQGAPALIHISELSWNRVTDPSTILNVGQEVEVKVCRLDRYLQRISLSLKQMQPDPLRETLESLELRGAEIDGDVNETSAMPELMGLTGRLEAYKGINSVQIGRRLLGNALAPTFQVYLSDQLDDGFKLLARSGNLVQEVLVQTALDRESMKDAIRQCTFSDN